MHDRDTTATAAGGARFSDISDRAFFSRASEFKTEQRTEVDSPEIAPAVDVGPFEKAVPHNEQILIQDEEILENSGESDTIKDGLKLANQREMKEKEEYKPSKNSSEQELQSKSEKQSEESEDDTVVLPTVSRVPFQV